jgi:hypothetical protein
MCPGALHVGTNTYQAETIFLTYCRYLKLLGYILAILAESITKKNPGNCNICMAT